MNTGQSPCVLVSTTQRCGSTWLAIICCKIIGQLRPADYVGGLSFGLMNFEDFGICEEEKVQAFSSAVREMREAHGSRVFKTHDLPPRLVPEFLKQNPDFIVANVVRDFKDVLISRLMYNRYYLPKRGWALESKFVAENAHLTDAELVNGFYGTTDMMEWLVQWKIFNEPGHHENSFRFSYEKMLTAEGLEQAVMTLGNRLLPEVISQDAVRTIMESTSFEKVEINMRQDRPNREVKTEFCRKGIAGDYLRFLSKRRSAALDILAK